LKSLVRDARISTWQVVVTEREHAAKRRGESVEFGPRLF
jgi:hypothetical protein